MCLANGGDSLSPLNLIEGETVMAKQKKSKKTIKFTFKNSVNFWNGKINFKLPKKWGKWIKT